MRQKTYKIHWYGWECASAADELAAMKSENSDLQRKYTWEAHLRENSETSYSAVYNINKELRAENAALKSELERMRAVVDAAKEYYSVWGGSNPSAEQMRNLLRAVEKLEATK
jgi:hypothetical protein